MTRGRLVAAAVLVSVPLAIAVPVANRLLGAEHSRVELSLVIYDLAGITRYSGVDVFPPTGRADTVAINRACYSPISWDRYAWWGPSPCPIGFATLEGPLTAPGVSATGLWMRAAVAHPIAYAVHRVAHFNQDVRFWTDQRRLPTLSLESDPNPWGYAVSPNRIADLIGHAAMASLATPIGWPACWLALAAAVLVAGTTEPLAIALAASSLLYGFSYLPLGVASEVRYHLWTMIAAALAAILGLGRPAPASAARRGAAIAIVLGVTLLAALARLA